MDDPVTVGEVIRAGIGSQDRLCVFVETVRRGEAMFEDEKTLGRSKSLGASLAHAITHAFAENERKILALLISSRVS